MMSEFEVFKTGNATVGDIVAQDILDIDFRSCEIDGQREKLVVKKFLKNYKRKENNCCQEASGQWLTGSTCLLKQS